MALDLNFGDVVPNELIPEGFYQVSVEDVTIEDSKATPGNKNLVLTLTIVGPDSVDEGLIGRKIREIVSLAASARWKLQLVLEALTQIEWRDDGMSLDPRDLMGMMGKVVVFHNTSNKGTVYANIKSWHPAYDKTEA
jgi:hypothetical protein